MRKNCYFAATDFFLLWEDAMGSRLARIATAATVAAWLAAATANAQAPAAAPPVDAAGAAALAKSLADTLATLIPAGKGDGKRAQVFSGPPVVMPAGDHYVAALPSVSARGDDGSRVDIGSIWLTLRPQADGGFFTTMNLPGSLTFMKEGDPAAVVTLGEQKIEGLWSPKYLTFLTIDASIADLQVTSVYEDYWFGVSSISMTQDLKPEPTAGQGWSGPAALALTEVRLDKGDETLLNIAEMTVESVYSRFRLDKIVDLTAWAESAAAGGPQPEPAALLRQFSQMLGGASSRTRVSDVSFIDPESKQAVAFDRAALQFGAADLDRDMASMDFGFEIKGLSLDPAPADESALPKDADMRLSLRNLPITALLKLAESALKGSPDDPIAGALKAFDAAKTTLKLESLGAKTAALQGSASGEASAKNGAAMGAVAKGKVTLTGVDSLIASLQPKKKNAKPDPEKAELLGGLTMLKAMGRPEKDRDGKPALAYTLELTPQGVFLLNDTDLAPLLEGGK